MAYLPTPPAEKERLRALFRKMADQQIEELKRNGPPDVRRFLETWNPVAYAIEEEAKRIKARDQETANLEAQRRNGALLAAQERGRREAREYAERERKRWLAEQERRHEK